jgi:hypothetical protein
MKKQLESLRDQIKQARADLIKLIESLPDHEEGVKMISPNCCTVSWLSITAKHGGNLSPSYYLSIEAKAALTRHVEKVDAENLIPSLERIMEVGFMISKHGTKITLSSALLKDLIKKWKG